MSIIFIRYGKNTNASKHSKSMQLLVVISTKWQRFVLSHQAGAPLSLFFS
jgi:hypothetical protein